MRFLLLLFALAFSSNVFSQMGGQIRCTIFTLPDSAAAKEAKLYVLRDSTILDSAIIGTDGKFTVAGLDGGIYRVRVKSPGYKTLEFGGIVVKKDWVTYLTGTNAIYLHPVNEIVPRQKRQKIFRLSNRARHSNS